MPNNFMPGESFGMPTFLSRKKRTAMNQPFEIPDFAANAKKRLPAELMTPPEPIVGPRQPSRSEALQSELSAMDRPMPTKRKWLRLAMMGAPIGLGAAFGGAEGASGAAEAVNDSTTKQDAANERRKQQLLAQMESERGREFQTSERQSGQDFRRGERVGEEGWRTGEREADQGFRTNERVGEQAWRSGEREADQGFRAGENKLERDMRQSLQKDQQTWQTGERVGGEGFRSGESKLERDMRVSEAEKTRGFEAGQNSQNRDLQRDMAEAKIGARQSSGQEKRALGFYIRANDAAQTGGQLESEIQGKNLLGQLRMKYAPNILQSSENQAYEQATRTFTEARLRKDSGAAIPPHEYENDRQTYFPQPGDSREVLKQKEHARGTILTALRAESGRAMGEFEGTLGTIKVIDPDGRVGEIPFEDWIQAQKEGYKRAQSAQ